ncbi:MAG: patatin-like phospholipase family protein [Acidobacteriota bacterium]|nr:patatin-like phospholipase family protein [Acidobacteriota bacterium]
MKVDRSACGWILDSGGAGRGAWQGGVLYEVMRWTRQHGGYPTVMMGASAGGFAAADVATGTEATVLKGWTAWGSEDIPARYPLAPFVANEWPRSRFRRHLHASIRYVMEDTERDGVFNDSGQRTLLLFASRIRRRDGRVPGRADLVALFGMAATRKLPRALKYVPGGYHVDPVVFATNLNDTLRSEFVRPLTRENYHCAIEASCLVPLAMGPALPPGLLSPTGAYPDDARAVFVDGGFTLKMPMALFEEDARFRDLARWTATPRTIIFCCDPHGRLWETSLRLRTLNAHPTVARAIADGTLLVVHPDHPVEASFLSFDPEVIMRTFERGREQGRRLVEAESMRRFLSGAAGTVPPVD